jgi:TPR repeat protein
MTTTRSSISSFLHLATVAGLTALAVMPLLAVSLAEEKGVDLERVYQELIIPGEYRKAIEALEPCASKGDFGCMYYLIEAVGSWLHFADAPPRDPKYDLSYLYYWMRVQYRDSKHRDLAALAVGWWYESGSYGLPKDHGLAECWRSSALAGTDEAYSRCEAMEVKNFGNRIPWR